MGATNVNIQLLAEVMCITRSVISLPTLLQDSEYHDSSRQIQNMEEAFVPTASSLRGENRSQDSFCKASDVLCTVF